MKNYQTKLIILTLALLISLGAQAADVTSAFNTGDTLTATQMTEIKEAVNSKQNDVTGTCPAGQSIRVINLDGTVTCQVAGGISTAELPASAGLSNSYADLLNVTINAPATGNVHVTATGMIQLSGKTNASSGEFASVYVGVTNAARNTPLGSNFTRFHRSGADGTGSYEIPYGVQGVFLVSPGINTFYLVGRENGGSGSARIYYNRLTVTFHGESM